MGWVWCGVVMGVGRKECTVGGDGKGRRSVRKRMRSVVVGRREEVKVVRSVIIIVVCVRSFLDDVDAV